MSETTPPTTFRGDRLLRLAEHLAGLPAVARRRFTMGKWFHDCGMAACPGGHACTIPSFRRAGLKRSTSCWYGGPEFRGAFEFGALGLFFGVSREESMQLFNRPHGAHDETPKQVAARIRRFVRDKTEARP